ncbi:MAG: 50S ribosomal protein L23 [Candidatus Methanofastidiosia archaeon]
MKDPQSIVYHPLISEQTVALMEKDNVLVFIVSQKASKKEIKSAVEQLYEVEVLKVSCSITPDGRKKAYVRLQEEYLADEVATKIGVF